MSIRYLLVTVLVFHACLAVPFGLRLRIIDGRDAVPGEFPYMVSIQQSLAPFISFKHVCGGSIVHRNFILTAGHCISKFGQFKVIAGKHYFDEDEDTQQEVEIDQIFVPEEYYGNPIKKTHDIAILKLKTPLIFNERISAINLPKQDEILGKYAVLSGWGSVSKLRVPIIPETLQKVIVPLLDNESCQNKFSENAKIHDSQICTDGVGKISACIGDSGGPLVQFDDDVPIQIGIVSWGTYPCGVDEMPTVYTRVSSYTTWIITIVWLNNY